MKIIKEQSNVKFIILAVLLLFGVMTLAGCGKKEEEYRQIQVYKIDGTATVVRQGSSMDAYENMQLQSGDVVETVADSYLQLKLDEDKYILVEPDSKISLQATGNSVDSKTSIYLEKGAIVNQLDNPLSEDSSYEVTTPNSTMAVRGTTFRVEITYDEKGHSYAKVAVYGGKVECNLVFPDGTITEPVIVESGTEVLVWGDDVESDYVWSGNTSYEELQLKVIDFLGVIIDRGEELSITKEEIEVLKEALETLEEVNDDEEVLEENGDEEITEDDLKEETPENQKDNSKDDELRIESEEEKKDETVTQQTQPTTPPSQDSSSPSEDSSSNGDSSGDNSSNGDSSGDNSSSGDSSGSSSSGGNSSRTITVEFYYSDLFASGTLSASNDSLTVTCPVLMPTDNGYWEMEKTTIEGDNGSDTGGEAVGDTAVESNTQATHLQIGSSVTINVTGISEVKFNWIEVN